ncbi:MAG: MoxR family ATPase [Peptococcaceae bacterium]|jgi:MoxR-like ATPase|nr:MoxR family ATPase [Peptococcaceae bacterium]
MNPHIEQILQVYEQTIFGQRQNLQLLITALLAGGHVLLEGVPGVGKTKTVRTLAELIGGSFKRIQFTPDLLPSDITGSAIFNMKTGGFETLKGPVFANILLGDEINRTPPKTQAALLEAMEETQVTIQGETYLLPEPFFVAATQNPVEFEGTYPLPEAQKDRFLFKLLIDYPNLDAEIQLLKSAQRPERAPVPADLTSPWQNLTGFRQTQQEAAQVSLDDKIIGYVAALVRQTRDSEQLRLGASPRAGIALTKAGKAWAYLQGRDYVTPDDIKAVIRPTLRHRIIPVPQIELEGGSSDQIIQDIVAATEVPR